VCRYDRMSSFDAWDTVSTRRARVAADRIIHLA
jgi:hypothetical protein